MKYYSKKRFELFTVALSVFCTLGTHRSNAQIFPGPLAVGLDSPSLIWTSGGDANWGLDPEVFSFGDSSVTFDDLQDGQRTWVETTVRGPGTLTFRWKVSSEVCDDNLCDIARFELDGQVQRTLSGEVDWQIEALVLPKGDHHLRWEYRKDETTSAGDDKFWLDGVAFGEGHPIPVIVQGSGKVTLEPNQLLYATGDTVLLKATQSSAESAFQGWEDPINSFKPEFEYKVRSFRVITAVFGDDYGMALDAPEQFWQSAGALNWTSIVDATAVGGFALQSGDIDDGEITSIRTRFRGPGILRFRWKVSSEFCADAPCDFLDFRVNGISRGIVSGETDWEEVAIPLPGGSHDVEWRYQKDKFTSKGQDLAWLDNVRIEPRAVPPISGIEYFIDMDDPGQGNAIALPGGVEEFNIPVEGLDLGIHLVTVRAKQEIDGQEFWSHNQSLIFSVFPEDFTGQISRVEYFVDKDPGLGSGTPISLDEDVISIPTEGLDPGFHILAVRARQAGPGDAEWSLDTQHPFDVLPSTATDDIVPALREVRFEFVDAEGRFTPPFLITDDLIPFLDREVTVTADVLNQPGVVLGRAIAVNALGQESPGAWFSVDVVSELSSSWTTWLERYFTADEQADTTRTGLTADPDHDGVPNLLEYATGGDPNAAGDSDGRLDIRLLPAGDLEVRFRALASEPGVKTVPFETQGLRYELESAGNDLKWTAASVEPVGDPTPAGDEWSDFRYQIFPIASSNKTVFFRLKITPTESFIE